MLYKNQLATLVSLSTTNAVVKVGTTTYSVKPKQLGIRQYKLTVYLYSGVIESYELTSSLSALDAVVECLRAFVDDTYYLTNTELIKSFNLTVDDELFQLPFSLQDSLMEIV